MRDAAAGQGASPFLSNDRAAAFLNLLPRTLEKYRVIGRGPHIRKFGRRLQYAIDDLQTWAAKRTSNSTSDPCWEQAPTGAVVRKFGSGNPQNGRL
jgi:hypothetical protein